MRSIIVVVFVILIMLLTVHHVFTFYEHEHYKVKIGILQGKNNLLFTNDIVILGFDTNIKLSSGLLGSARFMISFPDSRYTFLSFEPSFYYYYEILKISFTRLQGFLEVGIQNQSEFISATSNTNTSSFEYYYFFMPSFRTIISIILFERLDISFAWFGGYPIIFLPNTRPTFGVPVGYPSFEVGMREIIFHKLSFLYNPLYYAINIYNKF